jgi:hypothetical protein
MLNLFYNEPDPDRWLPFDRFPRRLIRRAVRGPARPGGQTYVYLNLRAGLDRIGAPYRVNDFGHARRNPSELACIIGRPHVLDQMAWRNPILFGTAIYSHPSQDPNLLERLPIRKILVPGEWMRRMCEPAWGAKVAAWPVGIDTEQWRPQACAKEIDVLLYDKVLWQRDALEPRLVAPIRERLKQEGRSVAEFRYGFYKREEFLDALARCRSMVFLCEHETQGLAYQQALSSGVPIYAWDRQGPWLDPSFYPHTEVFGPVSSVPYWDERCGETFKDAPEFEAGWGAFWDKVRLDSFAPRDYILENLTLEKCASAYVQIARELS